MSESAGVKTDYSNIAPRFGVRPRRCPNRVVVRGGWGLAYFPGNYMSQSLLKNPPFVGTYGPVTSTARRPVSSRTCVLSDGLPLPTPTDAANPAGTIIGVAQDFKIDARAAVQRHRRERVRRERVLGWLCRLARRHTSRS